ncbi:replication protein [Glaesserella parasuis]|uniref:replication protein n=1 Tax=Glaesserella parasuis TaxID=738 RepID=UPI0024367702|nr:replication protein [Glaesserella parasuis]MDG6245633.1 replication protein [Glaesserella parasuis]
MNAVVKVKETPIFKLGENRQSQEARKVSVDDGFTAIPNELLKAILRSKVLGWKGSYLLATILKTLSWHKESDWFTHSQVCEMMGIEPTKYHVNQLSAARKELIKEQVLFEDGKKTGVNLDVFNWEMVNPEKVGSSRNNRELVPEIVGNKYPEKVGNTKETITKEKNK